MARLTNPLASFFALLPFVVLATAFPASWAPAGVGTVADANDPDKVMAGRLVGVFGIEVGRDKGIACRFSADGKVVWKVFDAALGTMDQAQGQWQMADGGYLLQRVVESRSKLLPVGTAMRDKVLELTDERMVLAPKSGEPEKYKRLEESEWAKLTPEFAKEMARRRALQQLTREALDDLDRIKLRLQAFFAGQSKKPSEPCLVPPSTALTPAASCCSAKDKQCSPSDVSWSQPGWRAIGFRSDGNRRYRYQIESAPDRPMVTVSAYGDLDCDGVLSTFSMSVSVEDRGDKCAVGPTAIFRDNETE